MANYILYTYQFAPLLNEGQKLFGVLPSETERMARKQDHLQSILSNKDFKFKSSRDGVFVHQIRFNSNGIIILKLANNKQLSLEEDFKKKKHSYSPSCFVIIDNRENVQHIAIEDNSISFSSTDVVRNILEYSLQKALKIFGLTISIKKEYHETEFWQLIQDYPCGTSMVRFHFSYPNLPRVCDSINELISNQSKLTNSKDTTFELKSSQTEQLSLSVENEQLKGLVDASAKSGEPIVIKFKKLRKHVRTGKSTRTLEIEDLDLHLQNGDLFQTTVEKLIELLNKVK